MEEDTHQNHINPANQFVQRIIFVVIKRHPCVRTNSSPRKAAKLQKMEEKGEFAVPSKNGVDPHFPGMSPRKRKMPSPFIPSSSAQFTQNGFPDEQFFFYDRFLCSFSSSLPPFPMRHPSHPNLFLKYCKRACC
jgi:hypothetical protein